MYLSCPQSTTSRRPTPWPLGSDPSLERPLSWRAWTSLAGWPLSPEPIQDSVRIGVHLQGGFLPLVNEIDTGLLSIFLGFVTALRLAEKGAHVILACRHMTRASTALTKIQNLVVSHTPYLHLCIAVFAGSFCANFLCSEYSTKISVLFKILLL